MAIEFTCPACGGTLRVRDAAVGRVVRCGGCLTLLRVPEAEPEPAPRADPRPATTPAPAPPSEFPDPADAPLRPVRGTRFWLMVTGATLALGACGCCGLAALILPAPDWQRFESKDGKYRVELPAEPRNDLREKFPFPGAKAVEGTRLWTRAEYYAVAYRDLPVIRRQSDDAALDEQVKNVTGGKDVRKVTRTDKIEVGGFAAREFEYQTRNGGVYTGRAVLAGNRVYVLVAGGRFTQPDDENVRRFLESFELTDPNLAAEGKRREDRDALRQLREAGAAAAAAALAAAEAERDRER